MPRAPWRGLGNVQSSAFQAPIPSASATSFDKRFHIAMIGIANRESAFLVPSPNSDFRTLIEGPRREGVVSNRSVEFISHRIRLVQSDGSEKRHAEPYNDRLQKATG